MMSKRLVRDIAMLAVLGPAVAYSLPPATVTNQLGGNTNPNPLGPARAQDDNQPPFSWALTTGIAYSDNISRSPVAQSEETATADVAVTAHQDRPRLFLDLNGDLQYREYLQSSYGSGLVGAAAGVARYFFIPGTFAWVLTDNYGQVPGDALAIQTPQNRESVNRLETGPDLAIPLSPRNQLVFQARALDVTFQNNSANSYHQFYGTGSFRHQLSSIFTAAVTFSQAHTQYGDDSQYPDYDLRAAFAQLAAVGSVMSLSADAGYSQLKQSGTTNGGALARLSLTRKLSARSTLQVQAGEEFSDAAGILQSEQGFSGITVGNSQATAVNDPVRSKYAMGSWSTEALRTNIRVTATWRKEQHEISTLYDRTLKSAGLDANYRLTPRIDVGGSALYSISDFRNALVNSKEWEVNTRLTYRLRRNLFWSTKVGRYSGNGFLGQGQAYHEDRIYTGITWTGN